MDRALEIKAAITTFFAVAGTFLGWKGILLLIWAAAMVLDYISGSLAAHKHHEWDSTKAREGLHHKGGMILVVLVWYIITEAGSILENSIKMGAVVPEWLAKGLKASLKTVDKAGQEVADKMDKEA